MDLNVKLAGLESLLKEESQILEMDPIERSKQVEQFIQSQVEKLKAQVDSDSSSQRNKSNKRRKSNSTQNEFQQYLEEESRQYSSPLKFWKKQSQLPVMQVVARSLLGISTSSPLLRQTLKTHMHYFQKKSSLKEGNDVVHAYIRKWTQQGFSMDRKLNLEEMRERGLGGFGGVASEGEEGDDYIEEYGYGSEEEQDGGIGCPVN